MEELDEIEQSSDAKGFLGCIGGLDCSKVFLKNCSSK